MFVAPLGSALPTTPAEALDPVFENVGFCSDTGVTNEVSQDTSSIKARGGDEVDVFPTSHVENFKFAMIETNRTTLEQVYGAENVSSSLDGVTEPAGEEAEIITVKHNALDRLFFLGFSMFCSKARASSALSSPTPKSHP